MPTTILRRHRAALSLLLAGSIALIGAQQVLGSVAAAQTTEAILDAHDFQRLDDVQPAITSRTMSAAVSSGQFEELVRPTPVPTAAPTPMPTLAPTQVPA